ncbi:tRNA (adenosine(37)-N6)-threonylcarbamoyltransferase complex dimerization subunit type 1 TsaB [bacterium (Candidatus Blackallbacteria) CG17_big_fil_post_rev_8_21_14_2_50_48_46]|uniref:tRNA (Adenosine(37)-N6)-threonylcarbamoyltransferase complex dimerization subunit type 1 TsaB n=1 Tax=bacterium (Candidatus Blackallbacteria) CG17_big_fil_post_rev_8_21_14_2_50_48_46 TaxID=2014261 RepID=A0A2M7GBT2_9BACT|nr:MAG: tRNA (adenosine(37)-N6)-threonylcarbamoyltransferase complex dimerization subunit type 1 TsaB [bacterium (Candidatus Blackallbacteria) CG18_big_fil_WC_8_21_14_2_50_49_26]PIW19657.1 MAG: tRNA (adenosine(37)-N6)-threonylcarbamoyltransferase complex dimerization subunit type 1 TsaB [bacterium (Candidatus Blackallbacteria) CG17_big_fil_post_rev_8_21_14_2_50_48_46]PIW44728.1 MAG: tRNA (adenosine(37)-N6)-threonylcarbamoyltransferase complex dimerization subunit type 1 TsaB [bacterium (Candidatu
MLILGIDTTQSNAQIALLQNKQKLAVCEFFLERMESLPALLHDLFQERGILPAELGGIGFVKGPGNYTGIRAGLMVVKTLTSLYNLPLWGFTRLETALYSLRHLNTAISPVFNVRQGQFYTAWGQWQKDQAQYLLEPDTWALEAWISKLEQSVEGSLPFIISNEPLDINLPWLPLGNMALAVAELSAEKIAAQQTAPEVLPFYIRPAVQIPQGKKTSPPP